MPRPLPIPSCFAFAAAILCAPAASWGQASGLPPTPATQLQETPSHAQPAGQHAYVSYTNGLLNIRANNSSLNVILREIASQTGMRITGGVPDQRVFGDYGPGDPGVVIATLLNGTGVNVFLHEKKDDQPAELVLTPRVGGPTPPSPSSRNYDAEAAAEAPPPAAMPPARPTQPPAIPPPAAGNTTPAANTTPVLTPTTSNGTTPTLDPNAPAVSSPPSTQQPLNNPMGSSTNTTPTPSTLPTANSQPMNSVATPTTTPTGSGIVDSANPAPVGTTTNPVGTVTSTTTVAPDGSTTTTTTTSPNGTKTPEQIYQQLLKMQQQTSGTGTSGAGSSTTPPQ